MAVAMAVAYPDVVRAAGAVAGLAYGETSAAVSNPQPFRSVAPWFSAVAAGTQVRRCGPCLRSSKTWRRRATPAVKTGPFRCW